MRRKPGPLVVAVAWLAAAGCSGEIGEGSPDRSADGPQPGLIPALGGPNAAVCTSERTPLGTALVPIDHVTYRHTVEKLFDGDVTALEGVFIPFERGEGQAGFTTLVVNQQLKEEDFDVVIRAAEQIAPRLVSHLEAKGDACDPVTLGCVRNLVSRVAESLFRRPLEEAEVRAYVDHYEAQRGPLGDGPAKEALFAGLLASPHFLYRGEHGGDPGTGPRPLTSYETAALVADILTDGPPDVELARAATTGALTRPEEIRAQVERLLGRPEQNASVRSFVRQLLQYGEVVDAAVREGIDAPELRRDADALVTHVLESNGRKGFLKALLTTEVFYVSSGSAERYNVAPGEVGVDGGFVDLMGDRVGMLSHPAWLIAFAQGEVTDPVRRGLYVREQLLCSHVPPIPIGVVADLPDDDTLTMREKLAMHGDPTCAGCHVRMDGLGLPFEEFEPMGRRVDELLGRPVDTTGEIVAISSELDGPVPDHRELMYRLAEADRVGECFARHAFAYFLGREPRSTDACAVAEAYDAYKTAGGDLVALVSSLLSSEASRVRLPGGDEVNDVEG